MTVDGNGVSGRADLHRGRRGHLRAERAMTRAEPQVAVVTDVDLVDQAAQLCHGAIHLQRVQIGQ